VSITGQSNTDSALDRWLNWPRDPANGRLLCAPAHPMPKDAPKGSRWSHTNIETVGSDSEFHLGQEFDRRRCKDCSVTWTEEVPQ
jgi:hypothetical protein